MSFQNIILIIFAVVSLAISSLLIYKKSGDRIANLLLAGFFILSSLHTLQHFIIEASLLKYVSWFYVWPLPIFALMPVLIFFYFQKVIEKNLVWKPWYLIFLIPFIISALDVFLFYLKSDSDRLDIIHDVMFYPANRFNKFYGFFTLKTHFLIRYTWAFGTCVILWFKLVPFISSGNADKNKNKLNWWLTIFLGILSIIVLAAYLLLINSSFSGVFGMLNPYINLLFIIMFSSALILAIAPLYFPTIFHNFPFVIQEIKQKKETVNFLHDDNQANPKFGLDVVFLKKEILGSEVQKLFLDPNFDLNDLAQYMKVPAHHLSYLFNQHFGLSFANYRNQIRIEFAAQLIKDGFLINSTTEALALECGFISRSAFSKTFKSIKGLNSSEYSLKFLKNAISQ